MAFVKIIGTCCIAVFFNYGVMASSGNLTELDLEKLFEGLVLNPVPVSPISIVSQQNIEERNSHLVYVTSIIDKKTISRLADNLESAKRYIVGLEGHLHDIEKDIHVARTQLKRTQDKTRCPKDQHLSQRKVLSAHKSQADMSQRLENNVLRLQGLLNSFKRQIAFEKKRMDNLEKALATGQQLHHRLDQNTSTETLRTSAETKPIEEVFSMDLLKNLFDVISLQGGVLRVYFSSHIAI